MSKVLVPTLRSKINYLPDGIEFVIPTKKNWFILLFLFVWIGGWFFGEISAAKELLSGQSGIAGNGFLLFWLSGWTVGGAFAITIWFWTAFGVERVILRPQALIIRREVFNLGFTKEYEVQSIRDLRVSPISYNPFDFAGSMRLWGIGGGNITFDYGAKTFRFGNGLDEAEAKNIVNQMLSKQIINAG